MYNGCLKNGLFPEGWRKVKNNTIHEKAYTNVVGSRQISPHELSKCGRKNTRKGTD